MVVSTSFVVACRPGVNSPGKGNQRDRRTVGDLARFVGEINRSTPAPAAKTFWISSRTQRQRSRPGWWRAVGEAFIEVFFEAETVAIALDSQIIGGFAQRFERGFHIADVQAGSAQRGGFRAGWLRLWPGAIRFEEDGGGDFAMDAGVLDSLLASASSRTAWIPSCRIYRW